ncbi:hypothetical protein CCR75_001900 [Bremia lactucae]|uniref:5'-nucleotidase n=1 Tax=Bremia lactucae TaxID=4779 RepID=A0A976FHW7_BRELC|nr:hypothetical protein CCR75_001900 [Bremia lactucae]
MQSSSNEKASAASSTSCLRVQEDALFPCNAIKPESVQGIRRISTKVVFLTVNDVYELFPCSNGVGGLAELATMLRITRKRIPRDTHVIVTLNGDFLWRSERDRKDKGALMVELLNEIGIEYVVVGNHEFDFGAKDLQDLLQGAHFTSFGSNVRSSSSKEIFAPLVDTCIIPLRFGLQLGLFGVVTTATGKDEFAGPSVVFENEYLHARRCVEILQKQGANVIVALTHLKLVDDIRLATLVPSIHLILGGHDHYPVTSVAGVSTLLHKSGRDACWLGAIEMTISSLIDTDFESNGHVSFQWKMLQNRGFQADQNCRAIIHQYICNVEQEELREGQLEPLGVVQTALDGRRVTCRTQESNLGNLVADSVRYGLQVDVGLVNASFLKEDRLHHPGLVITRKWLLKYLPLNTPTVVMRLSLQELQNALTYWLRRAPEMTASFPHVSGLRIVYEMSSTGTPTISSIQLTSEKYEDPIKPIGTTKELDLKDEEKIEWTRLVTVGMPMVCHLDGWHFFESTCQLRTGPVVRYLVETFVKQHKVLDYPMKEGRLRIK